MDQRFQPTEDPEKCRLAIQGLMDHYCLYRGKYVVMSPEYTKTTMHYYKEAVIASHVEGRYAVGVFAGAKATRFITFDVDAGGKAVVRKLIATLVEMGFPKDYIYISTSGRKGYHVDLFFEPYIYNEKAKNIYDLVIWRAGLDPKKVEFRPTHRQAIKLPLGIHAKTGNRCWFLDRDTLEPIKDMEYVCGIKHIDTSLASDILKTWNHKRWNEMYIEMVCDDTPRSRNNRLSYDFNRKDEYYAEHRLTEKNTRHDMMLEIARDVRYNGANAVQIEKILLGWYYKQDPVYITSSEEEVREDARDIAEWAEKNVPVLREAQIPKEAKPIVFDKHDINYILMAPTSAARRVALLLWTYCKLYGATKISYERIAETVGCVTASAQTAVSALIKAHIIEKQSGGLHVMNGRMVRSSNKYFIPSRRTLACPPDECLLADEYAYTDPYNKEEFDKFYYSVLGGLCTDEYLSRFLTKPELEEVRRARK